MPEAHHTASTFRCFDSCVFVRFVVNHPGECVVSAQNSGWGAGAYPTFVNRLQYLARSGVAVRGEPCAVRPRVGFLLEIKNPQSHGTRLAKLSSWAARGIFSVALRAANPKSLFAISTHSSDEPALASGRRDLTRSDPDAPKRPGHWARCSGYVFFCRSPFNF